MRDQANSHTRARIALAALALAVFALALIAATALAVGPPLISATSASQVGETTATLEATLNPDGREVDDYHFQYITQAAYEADGDLFGAGTQTTAKGTLANGEAGVPVSAQAGGLSPATAYRFRLLAHNTKSPAEGTPGPESSFTTYAAPQSFEPCPNDSLRSGPSAKLPDCRAYEQVSPTDKNGVDVNGQFPQVQAALDGDAVTFISNSGIPGGLGGQEFPTYLAQRTETGWSTQGLLPPPSFGSRASVLGWTPDLAYAFDIASTATAFEPALLARASADGSIEQVVPGTPDAIYGFAGASTDDSKFFIEALGAPLTPDAAPGKDNLYLFDRDTGTLSLVGVLPDSACGLPPCMPPGGSFAGPYDWWGGFTSRGGAAGGLNVTNASGFFTQAEHAISADGDRAYFTAGASAKEEGRIYLREGLDGPDPTTVAVSASERTPPDPLGQRPAAFQDATADGSAAFFTSPEELTDDANTGPAHPPATIARANIEGSGTPELGFLPTHAAGLAVDGSHIYWANPEAGTIERANLEGKEVEEEFITGADNPQGVAVDAEHIYWTNAPKELVEGEATGTIGQAKLGATKAEEVDQKFITGAHKPDAIAVGAGHIYWGDHEQISAAQNGHNAIMRANLKGEEVEEFGLDGEGNPSHSRANALAIDGTFLYFTENTSGNSGGVARIELAGPKNFGPAVTQFEPTGHHRSLGIAVEGTHIYWVDGETNTVDRAELKPFPAFPGPSEVEELIPAAGHPLGLAADASHLYWSANQEKAENPGNDLYRYDVEAEPGHHLTDLSVDPTDENGAEVQGVVGASADGSYLYFVANGDLDGAGPATTGDCERSGKGYFDYSGECNLYLHHDGQDSFIARLDAAGDGNLSDAADWQPDPSWGQNFNQVSTAQVSPDGQTLLFRSQRRLTAYENDGTPEFYLYRDGEGAPICVSCDPSGAAPVEAPTLQSIHLPTASGQAAVQIPSVLTRNLSEDGKRVFFESSDKLVGADTDGVADVYEWEADGSGSCESESQDGGCLYLLSGGKGAYPSFFADASASGKDVFIFTRDPLVPQDQDRLQDVYDVRVLGGLASQDEVLPSRCEGEACREGAHTPPGAESPGSAGFTGPANPAPKHKKARHGHKKHGRKRHHRHAKTSGRTSR